MTTPRVKRYCGRRLSYSVGFLRALGSYVAPRMKVRVDQTEHEGRFFHVSAGNTEWAGGGMMRLSPGAIPDDGLLQVCLVEALRWWEALWQFPHLVRGTFPGRRKVRYVSGSEISIWTEPPVTLQVDGDILGGTPATWKVRAGCLRVLCPRAG